MLQSLSIANLALVESLRVDFEPGLNVITGETGAGKSLIVGALTLLLGERADRSLLREGAEAGAVEAVFRVPRPEALNPLLQDCGLDPAPDGCLVLKRSLSASAADRGRQFANNGAVTLQTLKRLGELLVDLHGPHAHQSLLNADYQLQVLDAYGRIAAERAAYREVYDRRQALRARYRALSGGDAEAEREADLLAFQVRELEDAGLREDEEQDLRREQALLGNTQTLQQLAGAVGQALTDAEDSALQRLAAVQLALDQMAPMVEAAAGWKQDARALAQQVQELARGVAALAARLEGDPARLQWVEDRLQLYHKLKRKYGGAVPDLLRRLAEARERLLALRTRDEQRRGVDAELADAGRRLAALGLALRARREAAGRRLAQAIARELQDLGLEQAAFSVDAVPAPEPGPAGLDALDFLFAPNPGEPARPLRLIASSGEMSRVMLAVKTVLADHDRVPVLVFDEIDVNLGGRTADRVGRKLAAAAEGRQVLCITHLPQVAAYGRAHFAVSKQVAGGRTRSTIIRLDNRARLDEIARMLAGQDLTRTTLAHARELLENAHRKDRGS